MYLDVYGQQPPPPVVPLGDTGLPQGVKDGTSTKAADYTMEVQPEGGEGLWQMAVDMNSRLTGEMKAANPVPKIYSDLCKDATTKGFDAGSADSKLPGSYQGDQKSGRDLDLIYASDKFKVTLVPPKDGGTTTTAPAAVPENAKAVYESLPAEQKAQWDAFAAKNPKALEGADQLALLNGFKAAGVNEKSSSTDYLKLIGSDGFVKLSAPAKASALKLADTHGAAETHKLVNDAGFMKLGKDATVPAKDDKDRKSQEVILERAAGSKPLFQALVDAATEGGALKTETDLGKRGLDMTYMALYAGREKGYNALPEGERFKALENLWNHVLTDKKFTELPMGGGNRPTDSQLEVIQRFVTNAGYANPQIMTTEQMLWMR